MTELIKVTLGHIEVCSWWGTDKDGNLIGMGSSTTFDENEKSQTILRDQPA